MKNNPQTKRMTTGISLSFLPPCWSTADVAITKKSINTRTPSLMFLAWFGLYLEYESYIPAIHIEKIGKVQFQKSGGSTKKTEIRETSGKKTRGTKANNASTQPLKIDVSTSVKYSLAAYNIFFVSNHPILSLVFGHYR